ncbi:MAG: FG-GAP repeat domain-containing protein [Gemmatimonadota bacterium]
MPRLHRPTPGRTVLRLGSILFIAAVLAACGDERITRPGADDDAVDEATPTSEPLALVEITITGLGGPGEPTASAISAATLEELERLRATRRAGPGTEPQALTPPEDAGGGGDGTIQIEPVTTGSFTDGERGAGGERYFWATYRVRNAQDSDGTAYDTDRENLTFMAVADDATLGGNSPIRTLEVYDGSDADGAIADEIVPTGAAAFDSDGRLTSPYPDVLQVVSELEAGALDTPSGITDVFPYGFVVRRQGRADTRSLPASPAADAYDGVVTFAYRMPLQTSATDDPFTVTALFVAYDDSDTRMTQSGEEQRGLAAVRFADRAESLGASTVTLLPGGRYVGAVSDLLRCRVRATGTSASPTAYVNEAESTDAWFVTDPFGVTADGPAFIESTAAIRAARCGAVWSTPSSTNFVIRGAQGGSVSGSYSGGGDEGIIASPAGDFFPGEIVEATLTTDLGIADPVVARFHVRADGGSGTFAGVTSANDADVTSPGPVVTGDLDGDGDLGLVVINQFDDNITALTGDGDGTFTSAGMFADGTTPRGVALGDFDGDDVLDIALTSQDHNDVRVLLGDGDGTFQAAVGYAAGTGPMGIAAGDFDGDGHLDLAVTDRDDDDVYILTGDGTGSFSAGAPRSVGTNPEAIAVGDFDGDGDLDVAVVNSSSDDVSVLRGNGDGTLATADSYDVGDLPLHIATGDFDGDGTLDLVASNRGSNDLTVLLGNGDGTFAEGDVYPTGEWPRAIHAGDLDADGSLDLAVVSQRDDQVEVLIGNGDGTFAAAESYATGGGPVGLAVGDFDGDGALDLAATNNAGSDMAYLLNQ